MRNSSFAVVSAAFLAAILWGAPASADITYDWVPITQTGHSGLYSLGEMIFSDAVIAAGSYQFSERCSMGSCTVLAGDPSQVDIRSTLPGERNDLTYLDVAIDVSFVAGDLLSGSVRFTSAYSDFNVRGSLGAWSGSMNSDFLNCSDGLQSRCLVTGFWQDPPTVRAAAVPEPVSLPLLLAGLFCLAVGPRVARGVSTIAGRQRLNGKVFS